MLVSKLPAFENKKYTSYDHFHGNGPYGKIPTKKEPIRTPGFTPRLPCHIIKLHYACIIFSIDAQLEIIEYVHQSYCVVREITGLSQM